MEISYNSFLGDGANNSAAFARAQNVPGLEEVYIWLLSQIGKPIDQPAIAAAQVVLKSGNNLQNLEKNIEEVMDSQLADIDKFTKELAYGRIPIC